MTATGRRKGPLLRRERTAKQKKRRLAAGLGIVGIAVLTVLAPRPAVRDAAVTDERARAEERMDACLDSLLRALGHDRHTVTAVGPAERHDTDWKEFRHERLRQLSLAAEALTAAGDTAKAAEARRLAASLKETEKGATRTAWARWIEWKDGTGRTHTLMQELCGGRCRALSTGMIH